MEYRIKKTTKITNFGFGGEYTTYQAQVLINGEWRTLTYKGRVDDSEIIFGYSGYFSQGDAEKIIEKFNYQERGKKESEFNLSKVEIINYTPEKLGIYEYL